MVGPKYILFFLFISSGISNITSNKVNIGKRRCYECTTEDSGLDCIYNPDNLTIVPCRLNAYCTTIRREYVDIEGSTIFVHRGCEEKPKYIDQIVIEKYFITYYRSCRPKINFEEPCNDGIGLESYYKSWNISDEDWDYENNSAPIQYTLLPIYFITLFNLYYLHFS